MPSTAYENTGRKEGKVKDWWEGGGRDPATYIVEEKKGEPGGLLFLTAVARGREKKKGGQKGE